MILTKSCEYIENAFLYACYKTKYTVAIIGYSFFNTNDSNYLSNLNVFKLILNCWSSLFFV